MRRGSRGPNLFEVMSKAPQAQNPRRSVGLLGWRRRRTQASALVVAEPLTEEQAAEELEAQRIAREAARHAEEEKIAAKRTAKRSAAAAAGTGGAGRLLVRVTAGRHVVSLNTVGCIVLAAGTFILMLGAYSLGLQSSAGPSGKGMPAVAAMTKVADSPGSPLLPGARDQRAAARHAGPTRTNEPDLSALLERPPARQTGGVAPNRPARIGSPAAEGSLPAEKLNYLQIESFWITRARSGELLKQDLADVQAFLARRGVATFARRLSNGYVLFSKQGFPTSREYESQREAFRRRIEDLGKEYRRSGGLYQFKGCLFVSYKNTRTGRPA